MKKTKNKTGKNYKAIVGVSFFLLYIVYNFLFNSHIDIEIFNNELNKMINRNLIDRVVCVKNTEIVNIYIKKHAVSDCLNIINKSRGYDVLNDKIGVFDKLNGILAKTKKLSFYMIIPSVYVFDKNFKLIEDNLDEDQKIGYEVTTYVSWFQIISKILSTLFSLFFIYYILLSIGLIKGKGTFGGMFGLGSSRGKLFDKDSKNKITFKDIAGLIEPKTECQEIVDLLNNTKKLEEIGGKMPKGMLFIGPPGNGKTLLAKAIAGECNASFYYVSAADVGGVLYGAGVLHIKQIFESARKNLPAIIFFDEIDSVGRSRSSIGNNDEEKTLNSLLVEMDGFDSNSGILVIGSTNRLDVLDKALIRPGRFDMKILIDKPVLKERTAILELYLNKIKINKDNIDINTLAKRTIGFSSAEIATMCNNAALLATIANKPEVDNEDIQESFNRIVAGLKRKSIELSEKEKMAVATHEAGHIITSWYLEHADPVLKVTITSRGYSLGYAQYIPEEKFLTTRDEMYDNLCSYLGGRCAEEIVYNTMSSGASNDLENVHRIAFDVVTIFGMNDKIGRISYGAAIQNNPYTTGKPFSEETAKSIDEEIKKLVDGCSIRVKSLLKAHIEELNKVATELYKNEELTKDDIEKLIGPRGDFFK